MDNLVYTAQSSYHGPVRLLTDGTLCTCEQYDVYYEALNEAQRNEVGGRPCATGYPEHPELHHCETYHQYPSPSGW
jgi:hypothetical protein|tara:strand:+ start:424 stop:651 length:228 start_codon:yes stop_codon:yes gene_type:complete